MDDQQLWNQGTMRLTRLYGELPEEKRTALAEFLSRYQGTKEAFNAAVAAEINSASICRECGGQCCLNGKYRISALDYLACLASEITVSPNFTQKPICPYSTNIGCTLDPRFRPADCVLFICDAIESLVSSPAREILAQQEKLLRECITAAEALTGLRIGTPLLIWAEKTQENNF